jgi:hypothetical protein
MATGKKPHKTIAIPDSFPIFQIIGERFFKIIRSCRIDFNKPFRQPQVEPRFDFIPRMNRTLPDTRTGLFMFLPDTLGREQRTPERETPALERTVIIYQAAAIFPENAVIVGFFNQAEPGEAADQHDPHITLAEFRQREACRREQVVEIFKRQEYESRRMPATAGTALAFKVEAGFFVKSE